MPHLVRDDEMVAQAPLHAQQGEGSTLFSYFTPMSDKPYLEDRTYTPADLLRGLPTAHYEHCTFRGCDLTGLSLSDCTFVDCTFTDCRFGQNTMLDTGWQQVQFTDCLMMGLMWDECNPLALSVSFSGCNLSYCSFHRLKLKKTVFRSCVLQEADFTEADLTEAVLDDCDLTEARFDRTCLEKADLRTARHFTIHPETNRLRRARFSALNLAGLLAAYDLELE